MNGNMMLGKEFATIEDAVAWYSRLDEDRQNLVIAGAVGWFMGFRDEAPLVNRLGMKDMLWFIRTEERDTVFLQIVLECMMDAAYRSKPTGYGCLEVEDDGKEVE